MCPCTISSRLTEKKNAEKNSEDPEKEIDNYLESVEN